MVAGKDRMARTSARSAGWSNFHAEFMLRFNDALGEGRAPIQAASVSLLKRLENLWQRLVRGFDGQNTDTNLSSKRRLELIKFSTVMSDF